jgi:hypothetical protein
VPLIFHSFSTLLGMASPTTPPTHTRRYAQPFFSFFGLPIPSVVWEMGSQTLSQRCAWLLMRADSEIPRCLGRRRLEQRLCLPAWEAVQGSSWVPHSVKQPSTTSPLSPPLFAGSVCRVQRDALVSRWAEGLSSSVAQLRDQWEAVATRTLQRLDAALPVLLDVLGALREAMPRSVEKEVNDQGRRARGGPPISVCGCGNWAAMRDTHNSVIFNSCTYKLQWYIILFERRALCLVAFSSSACRPFRRRRRRGVGSFRRPLGRAFSRSCGT